jgi:hypothetical protein
MARKEMKGIWIRKEEIKPYLYSDGMMFYAEKSPRNFPKTSQN